MRNVEQFEDRFDRRLRAYAAAGAPTLDRTAISRAVADGVASRQARPWSTRWLPRTMVAQAAAASVVLLAAVIAFALWSGGRNQVVSPGVTPTSSPVPTASPSPPPRAATAVPTASSTLIASPTPSPLAFPGWPSTSENQPGLYYWDGIHCSKESCVDGFMHNGYGSGDVDLHIEDLGDGPIVVEGTTPVTVAGHVGIHRRNDVLRSEDWIVDIDGATIRIRMQWEAGTIQGELDEAYAIIDSLRYEAQATSLGFRLVFMLTTDDWDSG